MTFDPGTTMKSLNDLLAGAAFPAITILIHPTDTDMLQERLFDPDDHPFEPVDVVAGGASVTAAMVLLDDLFKKDERVPEGEVWIINDATDSYGRIVNLAIERQE